MTFYANILACIDGSEESIYASKEALKLLSAGSKITLLSVVSRGFLEYHGESPHAFEKGGAAYNALAETVSQVVDKAESLSIEVELMFDIGKAYEKIIDNAQAVGAEVIVLGAGRESGLKQRLLGSISSRVIGYADRDVMIVPNNTVLNLNKIMAATDGSIHGRLAVRRAIDLAKATGGPLYIIRVVEEISGFPAFAAYPGGRPIGGPGETPYDMSRPSFRDYMEKKIKAAKNTLEEERDRALHEGVKAETITPVGNPWRVLAKETGNLGDGLIVLGSHGRTGLKRLLMGSVTQRVAEHAGCPILIVRQP